MLVAAVGRLIYTPVAMATTGTPELNHLEPTLPLTPPLRRFRVDAEAFCGPSFHNQRKYDIRS